MQIELTQTQGEINADAEVWLAAYLRWDNRRKWAQRFAFELPQK